MEPTVGRIVRYVMSSGARRPAIVVAAHSPAGLADYLDLTVFGRDAGEISARSKSVLIL